ncbi:MAG: hypothetical protein WC670_05235 [Pseudolabrys sp.]
MTVAVRREPTFHAVGHSDDGRHAAGAAHAPAGPGHAIHPVKPASGFTRFISGFQAISTLIGVPLALASGYSLYRTNFAPDATCSNLRASIVSMLDKNVDAATRRMLVKRDIEAFEQSCGAVDPDAHAAFKSLLAVDKAVAAVPAAKAVVPPKPVQAAQAPVVHAPLAKDVAKDTSKDTTKDSSKDVAKAELRPAIIEKKPVAVAPPAAAAPAEAIAADSAADEPRMSDTRWLDAVRQALVEPADETKELAAVPAQAALKPAMVEAVGAEHRKAEPVVPSKPGEPVLQPAWQVSRSPAASVNASPDASPLPPGVDVAAPPAPSNDDHPVPPGVVPAAQYANNGSWIGQIPFVGRMIERHAR